MYDRFSVSLPKALIAPCRTENSQRSEFREDHRPPFLYPIFALVKRNLSHQKNWPPTIQDQHLTGIVQ